jgi:hypothetical protein
VLIAGTAPVLCPLAPASADGSAAVTAGPARLYCTITDPRVTESSGLAAGGGRLYTVNDGGSRLTVYVLDNGCRVRRVVGADLDPYDVEDLARSADGTLWLADLGDNLHQRRTVAIELLTETGAVRLLRFSYPDGPHDAEALLLDRAGRPYLVTKDPFGTSGVYTPAGIPRTGRPTVLGRVGTVRLRPTGTPGGPAGVVGQLLVTGGAVSPDGTLVVLRTYTDAYLWRAADGDVAHALRTGTPTRIALPATRQGEAVTFGPDGRSLLTSTEGLPAAVHRIPLAVPPLASPSAPAPARPPVGVAGQDSRPGHGWSDLGGLALVGGVVALLMWRGRRRSKGG